MVRQVFNVSVITRIEFLGWHAQTSEGLERCQRLIKKLSTVFPVTEEVADKAIELRRAQRIKLADAIIASTALVNDLSLATRNLQDFKSVPGLTVIDPFAQ